MKRTKFFREWHREPEFMDIVKKEVKPGMVALDIGANIGYVTLFIANYVGPKGYVYAVEPSPRNFEILKKNIELNHLQSRVDTFQFAFSTKSGVRDLNISTESNLHSFKKTKHSVDVVEVKTVTIDDFFDNKQPPNFIKMDIEGAEVEVLSGIDIILNNVTKPMKILMELHPMYYQEGNMDEQMQRLFDAGFKVKYLVSAGLARPDFFAQRGYEPIKVYKTGHWSRGLYINISNDDVIQSISSEFNQLVRYSFRSIIKNPFLIKNPITSTPKIVRAIMMELK